jgi:hypothetical protein
MHVPRNPWVLGAATTLLVIAVPIILFVPKPNAAPDEPWAKVPSHAEHTDHTGLFTQPLNTGQDVTLFGVPS